MLMFPLWFIVAAVIGMLSVPGCRRDDVPPPKATANLRNAPYSEPSLVEMRMVGAADSATVWVRYVFNKPLKAGDTVKIRLVRDSSNATGVTYKNYSTRNRFTPKDSSSYKVEKVFGKPAKYTGCTWAQRNTAGPTKCFTTTTNYVAPVDTTPSVPDSVSVKILGYRPFFFGPYDIYRATDTQIGMFTGGHNYVDPNNLVSIINRARANGQQLFLPLTGSAHCIYTTPGCDASGNWSPPCDSGVGCYTSRGAKFDLQKWKDGTARYNTPVLKEALRAGVADGTIDGYNMMDEPPHWTWGGVMTKPLVREMAAYSKSLYPFLPTGVNVSHHWRQGELYCPTLPCPLDFMMAQNWMELATTTPAMWRDSAVNVAKRNKVALALSINIRGNRQTTGCTPEGNQCWMRPQELREWARVMLAEPYACAVPMWAYKAEMWAKPEYQAVFKDLVAVANQRIDKPCVRET